MTDDDYAKQIEALENTGDQEMAHADADDLLCSILKSLGYVKTVEAFNNLSKWYA